MSGESEPEESSRRRVLGLLGAALLALIGAGAGTSTLLGSDDGDSEGNGIDLSVDYVVTPDSGEVTPTPGDGGDGRPDDTSAPPAEANDTAATDGGSGSDPTPAETPRYYDDPDDDPDDGARSPAGTSAPSGELVGASIPPVSVSGVDPGDGGTVDVSVALSGNPARLWIRGAVTDTEEGGTNEVERNAGDTGAPGELQEYVEVRLWYDTDGDGTDDGERAVYEGTLAGLDAVDGWTALTETCVASGTHTARFRWELPSDAPNVVQTDGVSFSLGVAADANGC